MRSLWFKQHFVGPILSGDKTDTVRLPPRRKIRALAVGERVGLSVGPRTPFAVALVEGDETIRAGSSTPSGAGRWRRATGRWPMTNCFTARASA